MSEIGAAIVAFSWLVGAACATFGVIYWCALNIDPLAMRIRAKRAERRP